MYIVLCSVLRILTQAVISLKFLNIPAQSETRETYRVQFVSNPASKSLHLQVSLAMVERYPN
jgi:hypothetical protein